MRIASIVVVIFLSFRVAAALQTSAGIIEVSVRDSITTAPIPGTRLSFRGPDGEISFSADRNGQATARNLVPGAYTVRGQHPAYTGGAIQVIIRPDALQHRVDLTMTRGSIVSGRVSDFSGNPITQAKVELAQLTYSEGRKTLAPLTRARHAALKDGIIHISSDAPE
jgi:hypothetical protein